MIALVSAEMSSQAVDALGQQRNLDFGRPGIFGIAPVLRDHTALLFRGQSHCVQNLCTKPYRVRHFEGRAF
jgi:hypothetical protein